MSSSLGSLFITINSGAKENIRMEAIFFHSQP